MPNKNKKKNKPFNRLERLVKSKLSLKQALITDNLCGNYYSNFLNSTCPTLDENLTEVFSNSTTQKYSINRLLLLNLTLIVQKFSDYKSPKSVIPKPNDSASNANEPLKALLEKHISCLERDSFPDQLPELDESSSCSNAFLLNTKKFLKCYAQVYFSENYQKDSLKELLALAKRSSVTSFSLQTLVLAFHKAPLSVAISIIAEEESFLKKIISMLRPTKNNKFSLKKLRGAFLCSYSNNPKKKREDLYSKVWVFYNALVLVWCFFEFFPKKLQFALKANFSRLLSVASKEDGEASAETKSSEEVAKNIFEEFELTDRRFLSVKNDFARVIENIRKGFFQVERSSEPKEAEMGKVGGKDSLDLEEIKQSYLEIFCHGKRKSCGSSVTLGELEELIDKRIQEEGEGERELFGFLKNERKKDIRKVLEEGMRWTKKNKREVGHQGTSEKDSLDREKNSMSLKKDALKNKFGGRKGMKFGKTKRTKK